MRLENIRIVAKREYLLRVKSKGFWIGTLVLPLQVWQPARDDKVL